MNGIDRELDRLYAQQLAEEAAEKEKERLDKLPKSWVMGLNGPEYKHVRPTPKRDLPHMEMPQFKEKPKDWFLNTMVTYATYQHVPIVYSEDEIRQRIENPNNSKGGKKSLGLDDFDPYVKRSYK